MEGNTSELSIVLTPYEKKRVNDLREHMNWFSEGRGKEYRSIFTVPEKFRVLDPEAYEPSIVSIGRYHEDKQRLDVMTSYKYRIAHRLLSRHNENMLEECIVKMMALEERVRSFYPSRECSFLTHQRVYGYLFAKMMFFDGCFVLSVLLRQKSEVEKLNKILDGRSHEGKGEGGIGDDLFSAVNASENCVEKRFDDELLKIFREMMEARQDDWVSSTRKGKEELEGSGMESWWYSLELVGHDLLKVENQIPFFVVEILFDLLLPPEDKNVPLIDLAIHLLNKMHQGQYYVRIRNPNVCHLLHLFHVMLVPNPSTRKPAPTPLAGWLSRFKKSATTMLRPFSRGAKNILPCFHEDSKHPQQQPWLSEMGLMLSATELKAAGVVFKQKWNCSFLDVTFDNGVMEIPPLCIYDDTFPILIRNLIMFEQGYPHTRDHITYYALFMESMIRTPRDVKVLQSEGILRTGTRDEVDIARMYNGLCKGVIVNRNQSYLNDLFYQVNRHCGSKWNKRRLKWNKWRADLMRVYFSSPWSIISLAGAFIVIVLTFLQAYSALYSVIHHRAS